MCPPKISLSFHRILISMIIVHLYLCHNIADYYVKLRFSNLFSQSMMKKLLLDNMMAIGMIQQFLTTQIAQHLLLLFCAYIMKDGKVLWISSLPFCPFQNLMQFTGNTFWTFYFKSLLLILHQHISDDCFIYACLMHWIDPNTFMTPFFPIASASLLIYLWF